LEQELENPAPTELETPAEATVSADATEPVTEAAVDVGQAWLGLEDTSREIVRATRSWIQYGTLGFAVLCIVVGAVEALFGR
jgi:hypothetical protein